MENCEYLNHPCSGHNVDPLKDVQCEKDYRDCKRYEIIEKIELEGDLFKHGI